MAMDSDLRSIRDSVLLGGSGSLWADAGSGGVDDHAAEVQELSCACGGSGIVLTEVEGVRRAAQCRCVRERKAAKQLAEAGIPPRYAERTLDNYDAGAGRWAEQGLVLARGFVREWPLQRHRGLLFQGPCGVGKTHLTVSILKACQQQHGASIRFAELRELFAAIKETFGGNGRRRSEDEHQILRPLLECDILALDEVGAARDTDWQRETTEKLINGRYNANLSTLCTTNYANRPPGWAAASQAPSARSAPVSFAERAQLVLPTVGRVETLGDRIGMPMWSRLQEMCRPLEMDGEDYRTTRRRA